MKVVPLTDAERWNYLKNFLGDLRDTCVRQGWPHQTSYNEVIGNMNNLENSVHCPHCGNRVRLDGQIGGKVKCDNCFEESEV